MLGCQPSKLDVAGSNLARLRRACRPLHAIACQDVSAGLSSEALREGGWTGVGEGLGEVLDEGLDEVGSWPCRSLSELTQDLVPPSP